MTARRITGRAAAMATITVLFAGAAAAAASGVLPGPFSGGTSEQGSPEISVDPSSTGAATSEPVVTDPTSTDVLGTDGTTGTDGTDITSPLPEAYGLCTAWHAGHDKKPDNPAFSKLQRAADEMEGTVEEYCEQVFADKDASRDDDTDSTEVDDDADDDADDDTSSTDAPDSSDDDSGEHGSSGNSNGNGHGPKG